MVLSSVEHTGKSAAGENQRSFTPPFLTITYQLVDDPDMDEISWNEDGTTFIVWKPFEFARDLLPKYFKHNNFFSFVRQLNSYGFRKVASNRCEFANKYFRRGEKGLLCHIQRRKISPAGTTVTAVAPAVVAVNAAQALTIAVAPAVRMVSSSNSGDEKVLSSNSSPVATAAGTAVRELLEENERLRKENAQLNQNLNRFRSLYNKVYNVMSNFRVNPADMPAGIPEGRAGQIAAEVDGGGVFTAGENSGVKAYEDISPRLFGVSSGVKRVRRSNEDEEQVQPHGSGVKSEPLD